MSEIINCEDANTQNSSVFSDYNNAMATYITNKQTKFNEFNSAATIDLSSLSDQNVYNSIVAKKNEYNNISPPTLGTILNNNCCSNGKLFNKKSQTCVVPVVEDNYKTYEGYIRLAKIVGKHKVNNVEDCKKICNVDGGCGGFNYDKSENACSMYTQDVFKNVASYSLNSSGVMYDSTSKQAATSNSEETKLNNTTIIIIVVSVILIILLIIGAGIIIYFYTK